MSIPGAEDQKPFGSTLSASGYALASAAGLVPLAPVMGCDFRSLSTPLPLPVYRQTPHPGSPVPAREFQDDVVAVDTLDREVTQARRRAYDQLCDQAARLGADAVIDVDQTPGSTAAASGPVDLNRLAAAVRPGPHPYLSRTLEYQLIGTAVRDQAHRSAQPRLSSLSAADVWRLRSGGWQVIGVVGGCAHRFGASLWSGAVGQEIQGSTATWAAARQAALAQLTHELRDTAADGVVGIKMEAGHQMFGWNQRVELLGQTGRVRRSVVGRQGILVSITLIGTAIRRVSAPAGDQPAPTRIMKLG